MYTHTSHFFYCRCENVSFFTFFFFSTCCFRSRPNDAVYSIGNQTEENSSILLPGNRIVISWWSRGTITVGRSVTGEKKQTGRIYVWCKYSIKTRKGPFCTLLYFSVSPARVSSRPLVRPRLNTRRTYIRRILQPSRLYITYIRTVAEEKNKEEKKNCTKNKIHLAPAEQTQSEHIPRVTCAYTCNDLARVRVWVLFRAFSLQKFSKIVHAHYAVYYASVEPRSFAVTQKIICNKSVVQDNVPRVLVDFTLQERGEIAAVKFRRQSCFTRNRTRREVRRIE